MASFCLFNLSILFFVCFLINAVHSVLHFKTNWYGFCFPKWTLLQLKVIRRYSEGKKVFCVWEQWHLVGKRIRILIRLPKEACLKGHLSWDLRVKGALHVDVVWQGWDQHVERVWGMTEAMALGEFKDSHGGWSLGRTEVTSGRSAKEETADNANSRWSC